jgi:hypothetical protein
VAEWCVRGRSEICFGETAERLTGSLVLLTLSAALARLTTTGPRARIAQPAANPIAPASQPAMMAPTTNTSRLMPLLNATRANLEGMMREDSMNLSLLRAAYPLHAV